MFANTVKHFQITISSRNLSEANKLVGLLMSLGLGTSLYCRTRNLIREEKHFSLLKSPHINKKAQEHFGARTYKRAIKVLCSSPLNLALILKIAEEAFPGVSVKVKAAHFKEQPIKLFEQSRLTNNIVKKKQNLKKKRKPLSSVTKTTITMLDSSFKPKRKLG